MSLTLVLILAVVALAGAGFFLVKNNAKLRAVTRSQAATIESMKRNLAAIKEAGKADLKAQTEVLKLDKEIVNAKTAADAARVRRRFVSGAYNGL